MSILYELPTEPNQPNKYSFNTDLDGTQYSFEFCYNRRTDCFHFSVLGDNFQPIISNMPCLSFIQTMTTKYAFTELLPFGDIYFAPETNTDDDPNFLTFSNTVYAFYVSIADDLGANNE